MSHSGHYIGNALFIPVSLSCLPGVSQCHFSDELLALESISQSNSGDSKPRYQVISFSAYQFHSLKTDPFLYARHLALVRHCSGYKDGMTFGLDGSIGVFMFNGRCYIK